MALNNVLYGYYDPWGPNRYKYGSYNPETAILWRFCTGGIWRSTDAGRNWYDVSPTTDPPNSWNDSPAPTVSDLSYYHAVADPHRNKTHYVIAYWQNALSEYRGWMLHTIDDGASWTWYALGGGGLTASSWNYPWRVVEEAYCYNVAGDAPDDRTVSAPSAMLGVQDFTYGSVQHDFLAKPATNTYQYYVIWDFGGYFDLNVATNDGGINCRAGIGNCSDTMTWTTIPDVPVFTVSLTYPPGAACQGAQLTGHTQLFIWNGAVDGYPPIASVKSGLINTIASRRYVSAFLRITPGTYSGAGYFRHLWDFIGIYPHSVDTNELRPISLAIDWATGTNLYMTVWENDYLILKVFDITSTLSFPVREAVLGGATRAQIDARTYWASCRTLLDPSVAYQDYVLVFGQWNDGANRWISLSTDAGATLAAVDDGSWAAADWLGALIWVDDQNIVTCLNGATDELWETTNQGGAWTLRSNLPFAVDNGAMTMHAGTNRTIAIGQRNGAGIRKQNSPWTGAWTDITPGGAAFTRCGGLHWIFNEVS